MAEERQIDRLRTGPLSMLVGSAGDQSPITGLFDIGGRLHVIKTDSIYQLRMADDIDPERTNISIPNTFQQVCNYGSDAPIVGKTLLTAKELFRPEFLPKSFDSDAALLRAFETLLDLASAEDTRQGLVEEEEAAVREFERGHVREDGSRMLPSLVNGLERVEGFAQKCDHSLKGLLAIVRLFHGNNASRKWFESLRDLSEKQYGPDDEFTRFLVEAVPFLKFIRNVRNSVEHPDEGKYVVFSDFTLSSDSSLWVPTLEVVHPETPQPPLPVSSFMLQVIEQISSLIETTVAFLCDKHLQPFAGLAFQVVELPKDQRSEKSVRFSYGFSDGEQIIRVG